VPLTWLYHLPPDRKSASGALAALAELPAAARLPALCLSIEIPPEVVDCLQRIARQSTWSEEDLEIVRQGYHFGAQVMPHEAIVRLCAAWATAAVFGEQLLAAFQAYFQAFFAEDEGRIRPALETGLKLAQEKAGMVPLSGLLDELSHGVNFASYLDVPEIVLVPSYWASPLVFYARVAPQKLLLVFGSRPEQETLVPGEQLPPDLVTVLKSLADSTRLRILRYLAEEPLTPSELARRLRLRPPTVTHHLNGLRLAGLVQVILQPEGERRYALRRGAVQAAMEHLEEFLG
jgi:DNA-binding transcriptional ArsR family regulator